MTERRALILFVSVMAALLLILLCGLILLGAGNDQIVLAYIVVLTIGGLGVGEIVSHFHQ